MTKRNIRPLARNPNRHTQRGLKELEASVRQDGWVAPITVAADGESLDGAARLEVAADVFDGVEPLIVEHDGTRPVVMVRTDITDAQQVIARRIAYRANRVAELDLDWDAEVLAGDLAAGLELGELWTGNELAELLPREDKPDPGAQIDKAAELQEKWGTALGQLWQIGEHRLACGDCTDATVVARAGTGDVLIFDPEWDAMPAAMPGFMSTLAFCDGATLGAVVERYGAPAWVFAWDCVTSWYTPNRPLRRMKLCLWYGDVTQYDCDGWHYGDSGVAHDVHNTRGGYAFVPDPRGKHLSDVYQEPITRVHGDGLHSHLKPADWVTLLIANCTRGDVFDPFLGSGTTIVACERLGRKCRAIEIDPGFCAVAIDRWATMTGKTPIMIGDAHQITLNPAGSRPDHA